MRVVMFVHSLESDWNHGNAHFLRGVTSALLRLGHEVEVHEPAAAWSRANLMVDRPEAIDRFHSVYPELASHRYGDEGPDLDAVLDGADLVLVHEWNEPALVAAVGRRRPGGSFRLLFHDTHHRSVTEPEAMAAFDLQHYDGVLAFGSVIADIYRRRSWADRAWVWHEAADHHLFRPLPGPRHADVVWVGNWGDGERTAEIEEFLLGPVSRLGLSGRVHGVRYPEAAVAAVMSAGLSYGGFLPNVDVPQTFSRHRLTVHVPRRPYAAALPGIPTIRMFEALSCGIPLVSAPWDDAEGLFGADDYLRVANGSEMQEAMREIMLDEDLAAGLANRGRSTIEARHTCEHRAAELVGIAAELGVAPTEARVTRP
jgi:spore maturation protein CgeB